MTALNWMRAASAVTTIMVAVLAAILLPAEAWNTPAVVAVALLALLCACILWLPATMRGARGGDAAVMAGLGMSGVLYGVLLILAGIALVLGLLGWARASWAASVLVVAGFLVGTATMKATAQVVDAAAARTIGPSAGALWQSRLQAMAATAEPENGSALERLVDQLRFSPSSGGISTTEDEGISKAIEELESGNVAGESMGMRLRDLEGRISRRAVQLRAGRSGA